MTWPARLPVASPGLNSAARSSRQASLKSRPAKPATKPWPGIANATAALGRASLCQLVAAKPTLNSKNNIGRGFSAN